MSTTQIGRSKSGDRFYNPPGRRQLQQIQQQNQQIQQQNQQIQQQLLVNQKQKQQEEEYREEIRRDKLQNNHRNNHYNRNYQNQRRRNSPDMKVVAAADTVELGGCGGGASTATVTPVASVASSLSSNSSSNSTNLDRFMEYTTPSVPAKYFSKSSMKGWRTKEDEFRPYFVLGDLWDSFKEWSAYGAGVPILLNGSDSVVQYYVPYLSGIQLYIDPSKPSPESRMPGEESDESSRGTSSVGSSDCEIESDLQGTQGLSLRAKPLNGSSSEERESSSSPGVLIFQYFEHGGPFSREPLADKISLLASRFPELQTYRSCDLSSSSWVSVAWYPIYRIPTGPTLQNLDSCFLTFHSLSTPVSGGRNEWQCHFSTCPSNISNCFDRAVKLPLPIFGMACYKFKISMWDQNGVDESPKANSLLQAADEWLRHLNVAHPDYNFFAAHKSY